MGLISSTFVPRATLAWLNFKIEGFLNFISSRRSYHMSLNRNNLLLRLLAYTRYIVKLELLLARSWFHLVSRTGHGHLSRGDIVGA